MVSDAPSESEERSALSAGAGSLLFIVSSLATGGSEKKTIMMANTLSAKGHDVHLIYLDDPDDLKKMVGDDVQLIKLGRRSRLDWNAISRLRRYIKNNAISQLWNVNLYSMLYGFMATCFMRRDVRLIVSVNTTHFLSVYSKLQMLIYRPILRRMDCIVFGCVNQMSLWLGLYGLPKDKATVVYNGVDTEYYSREALGKNREDVRGKHGFADTDIVIGMVARFRQEKGHAYALEALQQLIEEGMPVKLMLVGDGPKRIEIEKQVEAKGLQEAVQFMGNLVDVREALIACDIYILTSIAVETFSNSTLEAMSMSKPVVVSNISGAPEMVDNGRNGYLFEPRNVEELVTALRKLMDSEARERFAKAAREKVCREFSATRMVGEYERVLDL